MSELIKLLYIEADTADLHAFGRLVADKKLPYNVQIAGSLSEARLRLAESPFDVIVADYRLPDGYSTELFSTLPDTPFILLAGTLQEQLALGAVERAMDDYLPRDPQQRHLEALPFAIEKTLYRKFLRNRELRLTDQLRESEARLRLAVETAELGTYERDLLTNQMTLNPACRKILGVSDGPLPLDVANRSAHPDDKERVLAAVARAFDPALREICAAEFRILRPDGTVRWVAGRGRVVFDESAEPPRGLKFIGVLNDITDRKLAEEGLIRAREDLSRVVADLERQVSKRTAELQEAVVELEQLSYSMIHDLRAPLRSIQSFGGVVAQDSTSQLSPDARDLVHKMRAAANRMDRLIVDVLNYTKVISGDLPLGPVDVGALVSGIAQTYPDLQPPKSHLRVAPDLPLVIGNEAALTQCMAQMMHNAVRFSKPGQAARIDIRGEKVGPEWFRIIVEDNGIGIAPGFQQKVFGMFQRLSTAAEGTGVGLAIVKKAAERMGGRVGVESELGKGSRFWIELKAASQISDAPDVTAR
jgi:PAS domain S-box-containing protein